MITGAVIEGAYRYLLWRVWERARPHATYVMLNPSTADASVDDATIRVCIGRAQRLGYGGILVANLFAYRATAPQDMLGANDPIGPRNDEALRAATARAAKIIVAWGAHGDHRQRAAHVAAALRHKNLWAIALTKNGVPRHPLRLPYDAPLLLWQAAA